MIEKIDWSKVKVDTEIVVWDFPDLQYRRRFAKYEGGKVYSWADGMHSWTINQINPFRVWRNAKVDK